MEKNKKQISKRPRICLGMIVKNESKIIKRLLQSVISKGFISQWVIIDTGSTDNTVEIIKEELKDVQGVLFERPWKNFGHNRSEVFTFAKKWTDFDCDYLLLLDADMELRLPENFEKIEFTKEYYLLQERSSTGFLVWNIRIIRTDLIWKCVGVTHEAWEGIYPESHPMKGNRVYNLEHIHDIWIHDHGDGGSKADKFIRDIFLLSAGLLEEKDNYRYMFYMGQSYRSLGKYNEAIEWYRKRIAFEGFEEERNYARFQISMCQKEMGLPWTIWYNSLLEAFIKEPKRLDFIHVAIRYFNDQQDYKMAYAAGKMALERSDLFPFLPETMFFVSGYDMECSFFVQLSVSSCRIDKKSDARLYASIASSNAHKYPNMESGIYDFAFKMLTEWAA